MKKILIIAGSDSGGGAGVQADIKTATKHKVFCSTIITSLTAQNTVGVKSIFNPDISFLEDQFQAVLEDINFDATKIGMLGNSNIIDIVAQFIKSQKLKNIILDPVMVATSGDILLKKDSINDLKNKLVNKSFVITPNIDEAEILSEAKITNLSDMKKSAMIIKKFGARNVLIKGGHLLTKENNKIYNLLLDENDKFTIITNKKIEKLQFHGTGCTLSTAIACNIANNNSIISAVRKSNQYIAKAIKNSQQIGKGSRVLKHF